MTPGALRVAVLATAAACGGGRSAPATPADAPVDPQQAVRTRCDRVADHVMSHVRLGGLDRAYYVEWCLATAVTADQEACFLAARDLQDIEACEAEGTWPEDAGDPVIARWCRELVTRSETLAAKTTSGENVDDGLTLLRDHEIETCIDANPTRNQYDCGMRAETPDAYDECLR